jgi:hypothetical protein
MRTTQFGFDIQRIAADAGPNYFADGFEVSTAPGQFCFICPDIICMFFPCFIIWLCI